MTNLIHATPRRPCPLCGGTADCSWRPDGPFDCHRTGGEPAPGRSRLRHADAPDEAGVHARDGGRADGPLAGGVAVGPKPDSEDDADATAAVSPSTLRDQVVEAALALGMARVGGLPDGTLLFARPDTGVLVYVLPDGEPDPARRPSWWPYLARAARRRGFATREEVAHAELAAWAADADDGPDVARLVAEGEEIGVGGDADLERLLTPPKGGQPGDCPAPAVPPTHDVPSPREGGGGRSKSSPPAATDDPAAPPDLDGRSICSAPAGDRAFFYNLDTKKVEEATPQTPAGEQYSKRHGAGSGSEGGQVNPPAEAAVVEVAGAVDVVGGGRPTLPPVWRRFGPPYRGRPCPRAQNVLLRSKRDPALGHGMAARCKNWSCVGCWPWLKDLWGRHLWGRLVRCPGPVHLWRGTEAEFEAARERISRRGKAGACDALYCRVRPGDGGVLVATTAAIRGATAATPEAAAEAVVAAIEAVPLGARRPVSASHCWKLPDRRSGNFWRGGRPADLDAANEALLRMGVSVVELEPARGGAVERQFRYEFPPDWDELAVVYAMTWAEAMTVPPGAGAGLPPPDPAPLIEALMRGETGDEWDWISHAPPRPPVAAVPPPDDGPPAPEPPPAAQSLIPFGADVG